MGGMGGMIPQENFIFSFLLFFNYHFLYKIKIIIMATRLLWGI